MAKFKVGEVVTEADVIVKKVIRNEDKLPETIELEQTIEVHAGAYGHENIKKGDVIEITGHLEEKARKNPLFTEIRDKDVEASPPNTKPSHNPAKRGSDEWLQQRAQHRRI